MDRSQMKLYSMQNVEVNNDMILSHLVNIQKQRPGSLLNSLCWTVQ